LDHVLYNANDYAQDLVRTVCMLSFLIIMGDDRPRFT
jgi:hypothetical protein